MEESPYSVVSSSRLQQSVVMFRHTALADHAGSKSKQTWVYGGDLYRSRKVDRSGEKVEGKSGQDISCLCVKL